MHEFSASLKRRSSNAIIRRHWSVGSNRINHLVANSEAWLVEGHCKLCFVSMESYDYIYREYPHPFIADTPVHGIWRGSSRRTLPSLGMKLYLQLPFSSGIITWIQYRSRRPDSTIWTYRLHPIYQSLPSPTFRDANVLLLRLVCQLISTSCWNLGRLLPHP